MINQSFFSNPRLLLILEIGSFLFQGFDFAGDVFIELADGSHSDLVLQFEYIDFMFILLFRVKIYLQKGKFIITEQLIWTTSVHNGIFWLNRTNWFQDHLLSRLNFVWLWFLRLLFLRNLFVHQFPSKFLLLTVLDLHFWRFFIWEQSCRSSLLRTLK